MKLFVGIGRYHLDMRDARSLKDKRQLVKSLVDRLGNTRVMSACEVGGNDYWKTCFLAVACVSSSHDMAKRSLSRARQVIEAAGVDVVDEEKWVFNPEDFVEWKTCPGA